MTTFSDDHSARISIYYYIFCFSLSINIIIIIIIIIIISNTSNKSVCLIKWSTTISFSFTKVIDKVCM